MHHSTPARVAEPEEAGSRSMTPWHYGNLDDTTCLQFSIRRRNEQPYETLALRHSLLPLLFGKNPQDWQNAGTPRI